MSGNLFNDPRIYIYIYIYQTYYIYIPTILTIYIYIYIYISTILTVYIYIYIYIPTVLTVYISVCVCEWLCVVVLIDSLVFYAISLPVGYLMLNPVLYTFDLLVNTLQITLFLNELLVLIGFKYSYLTLEFRLMLIIYLHTVIWFQVLSAK